MCSLGFAHREPSTGVNPDRFDTLPPMAQDRHVVVARDGRSSAAAPCRIRSRLVLLGTAGGSSARSTRCGFANALVVGDVAYLVDCGEGVQTQLHRAGVVATRRFGGGGGRPVVETIFLTHLHADHIMDLVNIFQGSWPRRGSTSTVPDRPARPSPPTTTRSIRSASPTTPRPVCGA